jgi:AcrR family transcriptional regulator
MARIRDFGRTRTLLVEAAGQLFAAHGYDRTAVETIITQAGVSKGAFYHHFSSKEEILDAVSASIVANVMQDVEAAVASPAPAIVRLNRFLNASKVWKLAHFGLLREVIAVMLRDENAPMLRKVQGLSVSLCVPVLGDIIQQGIDEGVFNPPHPHETARLMMQLCFSMQDVQMRSFLESEMSEEALAVLQLRIDLLIEMLERMLGAAHGAIERLRFIDALRIAEADRTKMIALGQGG